MVEVKMEYEGASELNNSILYESEADLQNNVGEGNNKKATRPKRSWSSKEEDVFFEIWGRDNWRLTRRGKNTKYFAQWAEELAPIFNREVKPEELQMKVNQMRAKFRQSKRALEENKSATRWRRYDLVEKILRNQYRSPDAEPIPPEALEKNVYVEEFCASGTSLSASGTSASTSSNTPAATPAPLSAVGSHSNGNGVGDVAADNMHQQQHIQNHNGSQVEQHPSVFQHTSNILYGNNEVNINQREQTYDSYNNYTYQAPAQQPQQRPMQYETQQMQMHDMQSVHQQQSVAQQQPLHQQQQHQQHQQHQQQQHHQQQQQQQHQQQQHQQQVIQQSQQPQQSQQQPIRQHEYQIIAIQPGQVQIQQLHQQQNYNHHQTQNGVGAPYVSHEANTSRTIIVSNQGQGQEQHQNHQYAAQAAQTNHHITADSPESTTAASPATQVIIASNGNTNQYYHQTQQQQPHQQQQQRQQPHVLHAHSIRVPPPQPHPQQQQPPQHPQQQPLPHPQQPHQQQPHPQQPHPQQPHPQQPHPHAQQPLPHPQHQAQQEQQQFPASRPIASAVIPAPQQDPPAAVSKPASTQAQQANRKRRSIPESSLEAIFVEEVRKKNLILSEQMEISRKRVSLEERKVRLMQDFFPKCLSMQERILQKLSNGS